MVYRDIGLKTPLPLKYRWPSVHSNNGTVLRRNRACRCPHAKTARGMQKFQVVARSCGAAWHLRSKCCNLFHFFLCFWHYFEHQSAEMAGCPRRFSNRIMEPFSGQTSKRDFSRSQASVTPSLVGELSLYLLYYSY